MLPIRLYEIAYLKVSGHALIGRDGEVVQYAPFSRRAWHAGESCYAGRTACNDFSVAIELKGQDTEPYTALQYPVLAAVLGALAEALPLTRDRIAGHCDIAPGRKTDPGPAFDWLALRKQLRRIRA